MRPAAILAAIASITSVVSAQAYSDHGMYERDLNPYLQARDASPEPYADADADADAYAEAEADYFDHIIARALDERAEIFGAATRYVENLHRAQGGKMTQTQKNECDRQCKLTYDNQMGHATKLKLPTAKYVSEYHACLKYCSEN